MTLPLFILERRTARPANFRAKRINPWETYQRYASEAQLLEDHAFMSAHHPAFEWRGVDPKGKVIT